MLRVVLNQANHLAAFHALRKGISSVLLRIECSRSLDRLWLADQLTMTEVIAKKRQIEEVLSRTQVLQIEERVLAMAALPLPTTLGTLDAIHLATAIFYRARQRSTDERIVFATHDAALARAAAAFDFEVLGA